MKIVRMKKGSWGKINAFFDIQTTEGFVIKGFKIIDGAESKFVGFPSQQDAEGKYFDTIHADKNVKDQVSSLAFKAYADDSEEELVGSSQEDVPF